MTVGFQHGRSAYEPEPGVRLGYYVGHGFKRFSRDRDRLGSVGLLAPFLAPTFDIRPVKGFAAPTRITGGT